MASSCALSMVTLFVIICIGPIICTAGPSPRFNSIYQFGESISDTGNLIRETNSFYCSSGPHKSTGRCSNGLLIVDYLAREFNLPLVNPYLDRDADFSQGANFAVAGATAINATGYVGSATKSSLPVQLGWFQSHIKSVCSSLSDCMKKLEMSLFVVGEVGANDYKYDILGLNSDLEDVFELVPIVVQIISDAVKEVINHGALHVVVPGIIPIGCVPIYLDAYKTKEITKYDSDGCVRQLNLLSEWHNENIQNAIKELQNQHPDVAIYYGDYFSSFLWVLRNAASLGFEADDVFKPCCGSISHPCGSSNNEVSLCPDPTKRISWDGTHQTQQTYMYMARWLLKNTFPQATPSPSPSPSPYSSSYWSESSATNHFPLLFQVTLASILAFWAIGSKLLAFR